jgi:hypothetical protein
MSYDGTNLNDEIARIVKCSQGNRNKINEYKQAAMADLGLVKGTKLTPEQNISIARRCAENVNGGQTVAQNHGLEVNVTPDEDKKSVRNTEPVQYLEQTIKRNVITRKPPRNKTPKVDRGIDAAFKPISFTLNLNYKRSGVSLDTYLIDALKDRFSLTNNSQIREWIETALENSDKVGSPIIKQVEYAIFMALISHTQPRSAL